MITFFQSLLTASFHGSIVILAVMVLRLLLKKRCFWILTSICPFRWVPLLQ